MLIRNPAYILGCAFMLGLSGCTTGASDLKLSEVSKNEGVFFGHIDFYDRDTNINEERCAVWFENEQGKTILKVLMDKTSWVFAAAPIGRIYLSYAVCAGRLDLTTRELFFPVTSEIPTYFGHISFRFTPNGIFPPSERLIKDTSWRGSFSKTGIRIQNRFDEAKQEYIKRYGPNSNSVHLNIAVIERRKSKTTESQN